MSSFEPGTVGAMFERPAGAVRLAPRGRWWMNRRSLELDSDGELEILVADGRHIAEISGTPEELRRLAGAILAQVDSAIANTEPPEQPLRDPGHDEISTRDSRDAGRPGQ